MITQVELMLSPRHSPSSHPSLPPVRRNKNQTKPETTPRTLITHNQRDEHNDLARTVDIKSDDYAVNVTQLFLRNYQQRILEDYDGGLLSAGRILEALERHTTLGYGGALGDDVPSVEERHVLIALEKMQISDLQTSEGLFWDLGSLNSPARDKAAVRVFLGSEGNVLVRTVG
jgi:hypothetical protein